MNTWLTDSVQLIAGQWLTSLYNGHGVLGANVPSTGVDGPPFGYGDLELPADAAAEMRWMILRWPTAGVLTVLEDSSFQFNATGIAAGRYFFDVEGFRDARSRGTKRVYLLVGPQPTLLEQIHTELNPLSSGLAWYSVNEAQASTTEDPYPFIIVQRVGNDPNVSMQGASELQNTRIQIDIHSRSILEADSLKRTVEATMRDWTLQNVPLTSIDLFDEAARVHRIVLDYSIWSIDL